MKLTRRFFLKSSGAALAYCGVAPLAALAQAAASAAAAKAVARRKTLVAVFLRGGADGLNLVVPFQDAGYYRLRRGLAIRPPGEAGGALDLDGFYGLHPRMGALRPLFDSGLAVAAHAVGYDRNSRSHFEEQDVWETGLVGNTLGADGWLNRHLQTSEGRGPLRAVAIGDNLPRILRGSVTAYALRGLEEVAMPAASGGSGQLVAALEHAYRVVPRDHTDAVRDLVKQTGRATLDGMKILEQVAAQPDDATVTYPQTEIARRLHQVARLIKADIGMEVAEVDYDGWDTHQYQGNGGEGQFGGLAGNLADALAAFVQDLDAHMDDVLVLTLSDFGRTAAENGTGGTDHGWGNCMLAIGGSVRRASPDKVRKVMGAWPGLGPEQLHDNRDLLHTTDFRDVLAEAVRVHLGNSNLAKVLPGWNAKPVGMFG